MNEQNKLIRIGDQLYMTPVEVPFPYQIKVEAAKAWLGDRYLLAHPIVKRRK